MRTRVTLRGTVAPFRGLTLTLRKQVGARPATVVRQKVIPATAAAGGYTFVLPTATSGRAVYSVRASGPGVLTTDGARRALSVYRTKVRAVSPSGAEFVSVKNTGKVAVQLAGWKLKDQSGTTLRLPRRTLKAGATVRVYTGSGVNTARRLFLGKPGDVWGAHDRVRLIDRNAAVVARLRY